MSSVESEFEQHLKTLDKDTLIEWVMAKDFELAQLKRENVSLRADLYDYVNALTEACSELKRCLKSSLSISTFKTDFVKRAKINRKQANKSIDTLPTDVE